MNGGASQRDRVLLAAAAERPAVLPRFKAWRCGGTTSAVPIDIADAQSLKEALASATATYFVHKDRLAILETDHRAGKSLLHLYGIQQQAALQYVRTESGRMVAIKRLKPAHLLTMPVEQFAPVEIFRWSPGCDVVGIDRSAVEGVSA